MNQNGHDAIRGIATLSIGVIAGKALESAVISGNLTPGGGTYGLAILAVMLVVALGIYEIACDIRIQSAFESAIGSVTSSE